MKYLDTNGVKYLWSKIKANDSNLINKIYPVGAIYLTYNNNNPGAFLGGTWERFGQGRTLMGEGTGNDGSTSKTFEANSSGGEYNHTLTTKELPKHSHPQRINDGSSPQSDNPWLKVNSSGTESGGFTNFGSWKGNGLSGNVNTAPIGESQSHNNIQPYITVYFWRRTA